MKYSIYVPLLLSLVSVHATSLDGAEIDVPSKPNIVYFLIDDLGFADCGFNGGFDIRTPNIDKLAKDGAILKSFYVQPVCSPTLIQLAGACIEQTLQSDGLDIWPVLTQNAKSPLAQTASTCCPLGSDRSWISLAATISYFKVTTRVRSRCEKKTGC